MADHAFVDLFFDDIILDDDSKDAVLFDIAEKNQWIPRSCIGETNYDDNTVSVREWFAIEHELV